MEAIDYELKCKQCGRIVWVSMVSVGVGHQWPTGIICNDCIPADAKFAATVVRLKDGPTAR